MEGRTPELQIRRARTFWSRHHRMSKVTCGTRPLNQFASISYKLPQAPVNYTDATAFWKQNKHPQNESWLTVCDSLWQSLFLICVGASVLHAGLSPPAGRRGMTREDERAMHNKNNQKRFLFVFTPLKDQSVYIPMLFVTVWCRLLPQSQHHYE